MRFILRSFVLAVALGVLGSTSSARAGAEADPFVVGAGHYSAERWQAACDEFKKLLAAAPNHPRANQARFFYGEALSQLGRYAEARTQFAELLARDPENRYARQAQFRGGEAAFLAGDATAARRELEAFRDAYPNDELNAYTLAYLGSLQLQDGDNEAARQLFSTALAKFNDGPLADECRLGLAEAQEQLGQIEPARAGLLALIDNGGPLSDQAMLQLGTLQNGQGEHAAALATLEQLATKFPERAVQDKARLARGYALYKLSRYAEAEEVLRKLTSHPSLGVEAHYRLGLSQQARGEWDEAAKTLLAGAELEPRNPLNAALGFHAADSLMRCQHYQAARDALDRVITQWPDSSWSDDCLLGKVRIAAFEKQYVECVRLANEFEAKYVESPLEPQVALAKCQALVALGRLAEAKQTLSAVRPGKDTDEPVAESRDELAESALAAGDVALANEIFESMTTPDSSAESIRRGRSGMAWCKFKSEDWNGAEIDFDRLRQDPQNPSAAEATLMRGRALEHLDRYDEALAMYHAVIEKHAASERTAEAVWRGARLHDQLQQSAPAIELYAKLVEQYPDFAELDAALYRWGWLVREKQPTEADELFERLHRDYPQSRFAVDAALRLAERAVAHKQYQAAERLLSELIQPSVATQLRQHAWYLQGRMAMAREQWAAVEPPLTQLIESDPQGELALSAAYLLAEASYRQGHFEIAAERLADLASKTKGRDETWSAAAELRRAQALAQIGEWSQSLEIARAIENQFPDFPQRFEVDYLIGRCLAAQAEFDEAREAYGRVIRSPRGGNTQTAAMARWMTGESYFHQENYTAAIVEYLAVEKEYPFPRWQATALLQAGKCHELLGQWRSAADVYERLLKTYPTSEVNEEATRRMTAAQQCAQTTAKLK